MPTLPASAILLRAAARRAMGGLAGPRGVASAAASPAAHAPVPAPSRRPPRRRLAAPPAAKGSAAMRELMQSRDDRRADQLEAQAPTSELV
jgi:hypothetical protein